jgi:hypothetical protein
MADTLLQDAIAEARQVKEAAIANAKIALEEAFTPQLSSMLAKKLRNEMEDATKNDAHGSEDGGETDRKAIEEEEGTVEEQTTLDSSGVGTGDNKQPNSNVRTSSDIENPDQEVEAYGEGDSGADPKIGGKDPAPKGTDAHPTTLHEDEFGGDDEDELGLDDEPEVDLDPAMGGLGGEEPQMGIEPGMEPDMGDEFGDEEEPDLDLEALIRELEAAVLGHTREQAPVAAPIAVAEEDQSDIAAGDGHEQTVDMKGDKAPEGEKAMLKLSETDDNDEDDEEGEEEIDLEEILREMDVEAQGKDPHYYAKVAEHLQTENVNLKRSLKEHRNVVKFLKNRINEINMVNAKLLYANKLFKQFDLNNQQKARIIETFDRAINVREVKMVYATLAEAYTGKTAAPTKKVRQITEGMASKPVGSTKPKTKAATQVINEEADVIRSRFQKLAGIIKG